MKTIFAPLIIVATLVTVSWAKDEIPLNLKADQLKFTDNSQVVEAIGSVEAKFEFVTIRADRILMDSVTNIATAEGHVSLYYEKYSASASALTYDANQNSATFSDFASRMRLKKGNGQLYLTARQVDDLKTVMKGKTGQLTTCEDKDPHFHLLADRIDYYPDDRIDAWNVTFYVGETPLFWLPYFTYDLNQDRRRNWVFGHNAVEGDFLKTYWVYPAGLLLLDYMDKKGLGYGTQVGYGLGALGLGSLYLYHLNEKDNGTPDWVEKIDHTIQLNDKTALKLNQRYVTTYLIPSGRMDQTAFGVDLKNRDTSPWNLNFNVLDDRYSNYEKYGLTYNQTWGKSTANYYYNYDFGKNDPQWLRKSQRLYYRTPLLSDRVNFSTTTNYYQYMANPADAGQEKVEPQVEFSGAEKYFSWRYTENWFLDLRQKLYPGTVKYEFVERQPEIELAAKPVDLKVLNVTSRLNYGTYRETKNVPQLGRIRDYTSQRYKLTLDGNKTFPLILGTSLLVGLGLDQNLYTPGDQLYAYRESVGLQTSLWSCFRNDLNFRKGMTDGNTPFFFDKVGTNYRDIRDRISLYYQTKFNWWVEGGRNYYTHKWFDVMSQMVIAPDKQIRWTINSGWDIENTRHKDLVTSMRWVPCSYFGLDLAAVKDMNLGLLRSANALYDIYFLEKQPNQIHLRFSQVYDPNSQDFRVRDIMLVKELHCWDMKYTYSDYRKEFSLVFSLKARPEEPAGFSSGRGFYFEGFDEEMKNLKPESAIQRY